MEHAAGMSGTSIRARRLVARGSDPAVLENATLCFEGETITGTQSAALSSPSPEYPDTLIVPSLSNAHDHGRGLKTLAYGAADTAVEAWVPATYTIPQLDPYLVSAAAFARMARAGITSIVHCQLSGPPLLETAGAVARAARDVGVRVAFVVPLRDRARLGYGADDAILAHMASADRDAIATRWLRPIAPIAEQLDLVDRIAEQHAGPSFAVQYGPVGMEWCSDQLLGQVAARAATSQRRIHMHLLESRYQREWTNRHYPDGPVTRLAELGLLSPRLTLAHGTWLRPGENEILAAHGVTVSVNTSSNLRLKSGVAALHAMKIAQLKFAIGLDALALDDDDDMLRELRLTHLLHAGRGFDTHVTRADIFGAACQAGACAVCGDNNAGELVAGAPADFIVLSYRRLAADVDPRLDDPFVSFFTRARQDHIDSVYCAGRAIVRDGRVLGVDLGTIEKELARQLAAAVPDLVKLRPLLRSFQQGLERFYASDGHRHG
jgi:cytosine/adenosine deaminase-related metal-dependent hydrolase